MDRPQPIRVRSFPPLADRRATFLILGSMPGVASLDAGEYYAHPRNAFWPIMGELFGATPEFSYQNRCQRLQAAGVAVWDVLQECQREGSLDTNINRATEVANDIGGLLESCPRIERILFNGQKAESAFRQHVVPTLEQPRLAKLCFRRLPSTSPAHAGRSFGEKLAEWRAALC